MNFSFGRLPATSLWMEPGEKLRAIMKHLEKNQDEMAEVFGVSQPTINRWIKTVGPTTPQGDKIVAINDLYEKTFSSGEEGTSIVPLMGRVGAGAVIEPDYEQTPEEGLEQVEVRMALPPGMICFEVDGNSMLPALRHGARLIVWAEQKRPLEAFYGREAVVRTEDGRRYVKTILKGSRPGLVNLQSFNDPEPITDQRLVWIGEIYATLPPSFSTIQKR